MFLGSVWLASSVITFQLGGISSRMQMADVTHMHTSCLQVRRFSRRLFRGVEKRSESVMKLLTPHMAWMFDALMQVLMKMDGDIYRRKLPFSARISSDALAVFVTRWLMLHLDVISLSICEVKQNMIKSEIPVWVIIGHYYITGTGLTREPHGVNNGSQLSAVLSC